jgi:hypothetical protein
MPPKIEKALVNTVEVIDSDDDEGGVGHATTTSDALGNIETASHDGIQAQQTLAESQSFWKAGAYDACPTWRPPADGALLEHARVHPKFLHSNATSHRWAFGGKPLKAK